MTEVALTWKNHSNTYKNYVIDRYQIDDRLSITTLYLKLLIYIVLIIIIGFNMRVNGLTYKN
jgi:uncharacterized membrane protein